MYRCARCLSRCQSTRTVPAAKSALPARWWLQQWLGREQEVTMQEVTKQELSMQELSMQEVTKQEATQRLVVA
jgi:hypothetical protein